MLIEKDLTTFDEFQIEINNLIKLLGEKSDNLLFREQSNSYWTLNTTAERKLKSPISLSRYYRFAFSAKSKIETLIEHSWNIPTPPEYDEWLTSKDTLSFSPFPAYDYLAYLRHHGFPSPFLDWTASPYIAAFFAFNTNSESNKSVSVYCYLEHASLGKIRSSDQPAIYVFGPYVRAHRRHVLQQSQYSICVEYDNNLSPFFTNHESVLKLNNDKQDKLWKFNIPSHQRNNAIKELDKMNINTYSLFGTEDSLIESIATNEIIKNNL